MEKPPQLSPIEAHEAIQRLLKECDTIGLTAHARGRALERNVTVDDMRHVLVNGAVSTVADWNDKFGNWNYVVSGHDCDDVPLTVVIALEPKHCRVTVITVRDTK